MKNISHGVKKVARKGCQLFIMKIENHTEIKAIRLEELEVVKNFLDIFLEEILGLLPKRYIDFSI